MASSTAAASAPQRRLADVAPRLVAFADSGPGVGGGHAVRQLALCEAWKRSGGRAVLVTADAAPALVRALAERSHVPLVEAGSVPACDWLVVDSYRLPPDDRAVLARSVGARLAETDDHGIVGRYHGVLLIDHNLGARAETYADRPAGSRLLLGPRYALLREAIRHAAAQDRDRRVVRRVVVTLGAQPATATLERVCAAARTSFPDAEVIVADGSMTDLPQELAAADLAVSAAGGTAWELCALGVPVVLVPLADNQRLVAEALDRAGAAIATDVKGLADALARVADSDRRASLASAGRRIVDGKGAGRVAAVLRAALLSVRPARPDDARLLFDWANDPQTRASSFTTDLIRWDTHVAWLQRRLKDPASFLVIVEDDGVPVGHVRVEQGDGGAVIGVTIAPAFRGRGLAAAVLRAAVDAARAASPTLGPIHAWIRVENVASAAAFSTAGFVEDQPGARGGVPALHYRDDP